MHATNVTRPVLEIGRVYTDDQLASIFGFKAHYLRSAGGMISVPRLKALLLMTHAEKSASFEYRDYWDGDDLFYAGRGQTGDQRYVGQNRDVGEKLRELWVFAYVKEFNRRFLGNAVCRTHWWETSRDRLKQDRQSLRFWLEFMEDASMRASLASAHNTTVRRLLFRPFDENRTPIAPKAGETKSSPEQRAAQIEKRNRDHHRLLVALTRELAKCGYTQIEEMPAAIDLSALRGGSRTIFEAKTLKAGDELSQVRSGLSQLLEYRFFHGQPGDFLCLVVDGPISDRRVRFLDSSGIGVLVFDGSAFMACGSRSIGILRTSDLH
jgi:hypothetical protein